MGLSTWDWGAIGSILGAGATLIAAWVAWYIFHQWRNQKGSEVIAHEAKEAVKELLDSMFKDKPDINDPDKDNDLNLEEFIHFNDANTKIYKRILFIGSCIKIEDFQNDIIVFRKNNHALLKTFYDLAYEVQSKDDIEKLTKEQEQRWEDNKIYCSNLIKKLRPYALYQEKVIFKHPVNTN